MGYFDLIKDLNMGKITFNQYTVEWYFLFPHRGEPYFLNVNAPLEDTILDPTCIGNNLNLHPSPIINTGLMFPLTVMVLPGLEENLVILVTYDPT